jgi:1,4-alpha-glucan branching enzyme
VHLKGSLINKMAGDRWQRFANLRALLAHQWSHPGKQLLFMGGELAQEREWSHDRSLDWHLLERHEHAGVQALVRDLNRTYERHPALWERDDESDGFGWLAADDAELNVLAYLRRGRDPVESMACVANLSPVPRYSYRIGLPAGGRWTETLNTDSSFYGGSDVGNLGGVTSDPSPWHGQSHSAPLTLPPLAMVWLTPDPSGG